MKAVFNERICGILQSLCQLKHIIEYLAGLLIIFYTDIKYCLFEKSHGVSITIGYQVVHNLTDCKHSV